MNFIIRTIGIFLDQVRSLSKDARKLVGQKIDLIQQNPYRFKRIHSRLFSKVFRVRLSLDGKESRLVYAVVEPNIIIACILERKDEYKELEHLLKKELGGF